MSARDASPSRSDTRPQAARAARHVLARVGARFLEQGGEATGTVLDPVDVTFGIGRLDPGLYQGLAGLAVTYAVAGSLFDEDEHRRCAAAAMQLAAQEIAGGALDRTEIGLEGSGGLLWAATAVLRSHDGEDGPACEAARRVVRSSAEALLARLRGRRRAVNVDLMGGEAGALCAIATTIEAELVAGAVLEAAARRLIDLLVDAAEVTGDGVAWPLWDERARIVGLGHGSAGIAWALHRGAAVLGHRRAEIATLVDGAAAREDAVLDEATGNWLDPRDAASELEAHRSAWCYGAAGVRLARHHFGRPVPARCASATAIDEFAVDHLCCGAAGRLVVAEAEEDPLAVQLAAALARRALADELRTVSLDGPGSGTGLFVGDLGVAWALLHHAFGRSGSELLLLR